MSRCTFSIEQEVRSKHNLRNQEVGEFISGPASSKIPDEFFEMFPIFNNVNAYAYKRQKKP